MYRDMGLGEIGHLLSCQREQLSAQGSQLHTPLRPEALGVREKVRAAMTRDRFGHAAMGGIALGIYRIANAHMADGIRLVSVNRGHDPREFTLVPLGGAGGLHAVALALELDIRRVLVPRYPGVLAAAGLLAAPIAHEVSGAKRKENLLNGRALAMKCRELVTLKTDLPLAFDWSEALVGRFDPPQIALLCR